MTIFNKPTSTSVLFQQFLCLTTANILQRRYDDIVYLPTIDEKVALFNALVLGVLNKHSPSKPVKSNKRKHKTHLVTSELRNYYLSRV